jgi:hypothetical protein
MFKCHLDEQFYLCKYIALFILIRAATSENQVEVTTINTENRKHAYKGGKLRLLGLPVRQCG